MKTKTQSTTQGGSKTMAKRKTGTKARHGATKTRSQSKAASSGKAKTAGAKTAGAKTRPKSGRTTAAAKGKRVTSAGKNARGVRKVSKTKVSKAKRTSTRRRTGAPSAKSTARGPSGSTVARAGGLPASRRAASRTQSSTCTYEYTGQVQFSGQACFPVDVNIRRLSDREVIHRERIESGVPFTIRLELPPGRYQMRSEVPDRGSPRTHWDAEGPDITVTEAGCLETSDQAMRHLLVMMPLSPKNGVIAHEARPVLRWATIDRAAYYAVRWFARDSATEAAVDAEPWYRTTWTEYTFSRNLVPGCDYEWQVRAFDSQNRPVASCSDVHFRASPPDPSEPRGYWE